MNEEIEEILREINALEEVIWRIRGVAVRFRDFELLELIGNLSAKLGGIFNDVARLKKDE